MTEEISSKNVILTNLIWEGNIVGLNTKLNTPSFLKDTSGNTAFGYAVDALNDAIHRQNIDKQNKIIEMMPLIAEKYEQINNLNSNVLNYAAQNGNSDALKVLISVDFNKYSKTGRHIFSEEDYLEALFRAISKDNLEAVQEIVKEKQFVFTHQEYNKAIILAIKKLSSPEEIIYVLLSARDNKNFLDDQYRKYQVLHNEFLRLFEHGFGNHELFRSILRKFFVKSFKQHGLRALSEKDDTKKLKINEVLKQSIYMQNYNKDSYIASRFTDWWNYNNKNYFISIFRIGISLNLLEETGLFIITSDSTQKYGNSIYPLTLLEKHKHIEGEISTFDNILRMAINNFQDAKGIFIRECIYKWIEILRLPIEKIETLNSIISNINSKLQLLNTEVISYIEMKSNNDEFFNKIIDNFYIQELFRDKTIRRIISKNYNFPISRDKDYIVNLAKAYAYYERFHQKRNISFLKPLHEFITIELLPKMEKYIINHPKLQLLDIDEKFLLKLKKIPFKNGSCI